MKDGVKDTHHAVSVAKETLNHDGFRAVFTYDYREDQSGLEARREIVVGKHAVALVVFDPKLEKLVMIRQFRLGAQLANGRGMTVEIPAGLIDEGEEPQDTARRELFEETGLEAKRITPLCNFLTTPGLTSETIHLYYAEVDAGNLAENGGMASETEETFPFMLSVDEALAAVDNNKIHNGIAMLGLLWFSRHRKTLTGNSA